MSNTEYTTTTVTYLTVHMQSDSYMWWSCDWHVMVMWQPFDGHVTAMWWSYGTGEMKTLPGHDVGGEMRRFPGKDGNTSKLDMDVIESLETNIQFT